MWFLLHKMCLHTGSNMFFCGNALRINKRKLFALPYGINFLQALNEHLHPRKHCLPHWSLWGPWHFWVSCEIVQHERNFIYFVFYICEILSKAGGHGNRSAAMFWNSNRWNEFVAWRWVEKPGWHSSGLEMCGWIYWNILPFFQLATS